MKYIIKLNCSVENKVLADIFTVLAKKKPRRTELYFISQNKLFFSVFHVFGIAVHELVNTSCAVNQFHLTSIERV